MLEFPRIAIFASGSGSNALALKNYYLKTTGTMPLVITDNPKSPVCQYGQYLEFISKKDFETKALRLLHLEQVDWILLAGFMRILSADFISRFQAWHGGKNQILNIHPSMLPKYKGKDAYLQAWQAGETDTGISVHYVSPEVDAGEMVFQQKIPIQRNLGFEAFVDASKNIENAIYTDVLAKILNQRIATEKFKIGGDFVFTV